jgi:hypothetical protein
MVILTGLRKLTCRLGGGLTESMDVGARWFMQLTVFAMRLCCFFRGLCLYVRHSDPVARSGVDCDGERWFRVNVSTYIWLCLAIFIAIGWVQLGLI